MGLIKQNTGGLIAQTSYTFFEDSSSIFQDAVRGVVDPNAREGWYFKNDWTSGIEHIAPNKTTEKRKFNWYYYDSTTFVDTVGDFQNTYALIKFDKTRMPFFAIYTKVDNGVNAASWYKSRRVYNLYSVQPVAGKTYLLYVGNEPSVFPGVPRIQLSADLTNTNLNKGAFASTEVINLISIQSDSGVSQYAYELLVQYLGFKTLNRTKDYLLQIRENFTLESVKNSLNKETITSEITSGATLEFPITTSNTTWVITHNLGKYPSVTTIDDYGNEIKGQVTYNSNNQITIVFNPAIKGVVYLN